MKRSLIALALVAACIGPASAQSSVLPASGQAFLKKAIVAGEQEVADAKAHTSDPNSSVRYFANRMIADHTKADRKLIGLAQQDHVMLPNPPGPGPAMSGAQYMHAQLLAHEQAVALFSKEAQDGSGAVRSLAAQILPTLQQHLAMAQQFAKTGKISM